MLFDTHSLLGYSNVSLVSSQSGGTAVINVTSGDGSKFASNQQVTIFPSDATQPLLSNAMVARVTGVSGDQLTLDYSLSSREGSTTRTIQVGDQIANTITPKALTDIETTANQALTFALAL